MTPPDRSEPLRSGARWVESSRTGFLASCPHGRDRPGRLDETARRLTHEELAVAQLLVGEGHDVRSRSETPGRGRTSDLMVCGHGVEVKTWNPIDRRDGRAPTARSVLNKLLDAGGQAKAVVLFGRGRRIDPATARKGLALYAGHRFGSRINAVRVLGDGFDLSWSRLVLGGLSDPVPADPGRRRGRRRPGSGLVVIEGRPRPAREGPGLAL